MIKFLKNNINKKQLITFLIGSFIVFILKLIWNKYNVQINDFIKNIFSDWIFNAVTYSITIPISVILLILILFIVIYKLTNKYLIKTITNIIREWVITTNKTTPQWTQFKELNLNNHRLISIDLDLKVRSDYMRFGFKFMDQKADIFGINSVLNKDNNLLIHIGKQTQDDSITFVAFKNGVKDLTDTVISKFKEDSKVQLKVTFIDKNNVKFYVNKKRIYTTYVEESLRDRICLMAWGDGNDYDLIAENIKFITEK